MSKFFKKVSGNWRSDIGGLLYDSVEDILKSLSEVQAKEEQYCTIYEVTETEVIECDTYVYYAKGVWITKSEFRKTIDYSILDVRDRFIQSGNYKDEWNEWAVKHNLPEEYLIK